MAGGRENKHSRLHTAVHHLQQHLAARTSRLGDICHTTSAVLPEHGYGIAPLSSAWHDVIGLIVSLVFGARTRGVAEFELVFRSQNVYEVLATT